MSDAAAATAATPAKAKAATAKVLKPRKGDTLDRSRDHGKCWSSTGHPVAHYYQDGKYYNGQGKRIQMDGDAEREAADAEAQEKRRAVEAAALRKRADRLEAGEDPDTVEEGDNGEIDGIDLRGWGMGTKKYRFAAVREAIQHKWSRFVASEDAARDFLVDQGIVARGEDKGARRKMHATK
jgi:hypothetical protein